jgi:tetratricopeptide (TPR) repeat protein
MHQRLAYLSLLLFLLIAGCLTITNHPTADPYQVTHHNWWNYYQRGRLYLHDQEFEKAASDFEIALGIRPGSRYSNTQERWRVRTYGMHMMDGYFPHRELGVALFNLEQFQRALDLLEQSMNMEPTARAKFYISRIHEKLALETAPPPTIQVAHLPEWTNQRSLEVSGQAYGSNTINKLTINDIPEFIELAKPQIHFQQNILLTEGTNHLRIAATDTSGKQTAMPRTIIADWTPPAFHLQRQGDLLTVHCSDNQGLGSILINGDRNTLSGRMYQFDWSVSNKQPLALELTDRSGNQVQWSLSADELTHMAQMQTPQPPQFNIDQAEQVVTIFTPEYELDIQALDDTALKLVELNGRNLLTHPSPLFRTAQRVQLTQGTNKLAIALEDFEGNRVERKLSVIYREPEYIDSIYRLGTVLAPIETEVEQHEFGVRTARYISHELTKEPVRFHLLAGADSDPVLKREMELSSTAFVDPRASLKAGQMLDSDLIFITRILHDAPGQTVYMEVFDTDSEDSLFVEDIYVEDVQLLSEQLEGLVMKVEQRFPIIKAMVYKAPNNQLMIDAGKKSGAQQNMRFLVIRSEGRFEEGRVLLSGNKPAEAVIADIEMEGSKIKMAKGPTRETVRSGDYVYSR